MHPDCVEDPSKQNYTEYGMLIEDAIRYENIGKPKFKFYGLPIFSQMDMNEKTEGLTKKYGAE